MPLTIPTRKSLVQSGQGYFRRNVPEWDPSTSRRSYVGGLLTSLMSALHDWYVALKLLADKQLWPQTATGSFFATGWWLDISGITRNPASAAQGTIVVTGTAGTLLPTGSTLTANGITYTTASDITVTTQALAGTSSVIDPSTGQFRTVEPHNLASGMTVTFSGMSDGALNGAFEIIVVDARTIWFAVSGAGSNPLEPNPRLTASWAVTTVTAGVTGSVGNLDYTSTLTVDNAPDGLDTTARVVFDGVADGADLESVEDWRGRVLAALGTDYGMFSADEIIEVVRTVPGVTRVFVRKPTRAVTPGYPLEGQVRVAFLRDHDSDPIPSALEVSQVRAALQKLIPAHMVAEDCDVLAPERYLLQIRFISISPDSSGMRASIEANIRQWLTEDAGWGGVLSIEALRCAIRGAIDLNTGQRLTTYELDSPTTDIALPVDAYPVLSGITWKA